MTASIKASEEGLAIVDCARQRKGWTKKYGMVERGSCCPSNFKAILAAHPHSVGEFHCKIVALLGMGGISKTSLSLGYFEKFGV
jgi:hypothetical protein